MALGDDMLAQLRTAIQKKAFPAPHTKAARKATHKVSVNAYPSSETAKSIEPSAAQGRGPPRSTSRAATGRVRTAAPETAATSHPV